MKFKAVAFPATSPGEVAIGKDEVVPDQALTLKEILFRFTRGEKLPVGKEVSYHESEDDIEKLRGMDPVDRDEFLKELEAKQKAYQDQEKAKRQAAIDAEVKRQAEEAAAKAKAMASPTP